MIASSVLEPPRPLVAERAVWFKVSMRVWMWGLLVAVAAAVFWIRTLPLALHGADTLAEQRARMRVGAEVAKSAARERLSPQDLERRVDQWIGQNPQRFAADRDAEAAELRSALRYVGPDQKEHVYLGDYDSYAWLRLAENYLRSGTMCDATVDGACWDSYANAPIGHELRNRSMHVVAIAALHRLIRRVEPNYPLPASAFWVPVIVGAVGVLPAFLIGRRLAGPLGGLSTALLVSLHPPLLQRSIGSDNDVWNVVLPLFLVWAVMAALSAARPWQQAAWASIAGIVTALHAATWSGWLFVWAIVLAALLGYLLLLLLAAIVGRVRGGGSTAQPALWTVVRVVLTLCLAAGGATALVAPDEPFWSFPAALLGRIGALGAPSASEALWPRVLSTVSELKATNFAIIMSSGFGAWYFAAALIGALSLVLPRRRWTRADAVLGLAGAALFIVMSTRPSLSAGTVLTLLLLPLGAALVLQVWRGALAADGADLLAVAWFVVSLYQSFRGARFLLLVGPGLGIAAGAAIGRAYECASGLAQRAAPRYATLSRGVLFVAFAMLLIPPARRGFREADQYLPAIDAAWWNALSSIRERSSDDAIVNTWWTYGYWTKYAADRRTTADGSLLQTHLPHWLGRALVSPDEAESMGLLRMLNCGPDAMPLPEGERGAYGRILSKVGDPLIAHEMVLDLARRDRAAAAEYLVDHGFSPAEREAVLATTHCLPPETFLVLSTEMARNDAWMRLGLWDLGKAYVADQSARLSQVDAVADFTRRLGYSPEQAEAAYTEARAMPRDDFVIGAAPRGPSVWYPCGPGPQAMTLRCPLGLLDTTTNRVLDDFVFDILVPQNSRLRYRDARPAAAPAPAASRAPGALLVADSSLTDIDLPTPRYDTMGVLVDMQRWRILVAPPALVRSTFMQLVYLDGHYARHFRKIDERIAYTGDRIVTFRVSYPITDPPRADSAVGPQASARAVSR